MKFYTIFWCTIPVLLVLLILGFNNSYDFIWGNIYLIITSKYAVLYVSVLLFSLGLVYKQSKAFLNTNWITKSHTFITVGTSILLVFFTVFGQAIGNYNMDLAMLCQKLWPFIFIFFGMTQIVFIFHLISRYMKR